MKVKLIIGAGIILSIIVIVCVYSVAKYRAVQKVLQAEKLQQILDFSNADINKCTIDSLVFLSSGEEKRGNCEAENPKIFAQNFSAVIKEHYRILEPDVGIGLIFRYEITFRSDDSYWIFKFDEDRVYEEGIIQYQLPNNGSSYGIIELDYPGTRMILSMLNEAFKNSQEDGQKDVFHENLAR